MRDLRLLRLTVVVLVAAAAVTVAGMGAEAQVGHLPPIEPAPYSPAMCVAAQFDLDASGRVDKGDVTWWDEATRTCLDRYGNPVQDATCDEATDVNRDGAVGWEDLSYLYNRVASCMFPPNDAGL